QRRVLLRRDPDAGPRGPPGLDQDELRRLRGELPPRGARRHRRTALLARLRRAVGRRAGAAPPAPAGPRGPARVGRLGVRARALPRRRRGPVHVGCQRRRVAEPRRPVVPGCRVRPPRGPAPDARAVRRAHGLQRARAHLAAALTRAYGGRMLQTSKAFSGIAVKDIAQSKQFFGEVLGLQVDEGNMGMLVLRPTGGRPILLYPKPDHVPAGYTVLNFPVD